MQEDKLLEEIERNCHDIWSGKEGITQQTGKFIMHLIPVLQKILTEIETGQICNMSADILLQTINALMEGLQHRDQYYLADILYFELTEIIKIYNKERKAYEPV